MPLNSGPGLAVAAGLAEAGAAPPPQAPPSDDEKIVGRHSFVINRPVGGPTALMASGPLIGNGDVGVMQSGPADALIFYIGKNGISESLIAALNKSLSDHELIKVKFIDFKDEKKSFIEMLLAQTGSVLVSITGNVAVLFRRNEDPERQRIVI